MEKFFKLVKLRWLLLNFCLQNFFIRKVRRSFATFFILRILLYHAANASVLKIIISNKWTSIQTPAAPDTTTETINMTTDAIKSIITTTTTFINLYVEGHSGHNGHNYTRSNQVRQHEELNSIYVVLDN